MISSLLQLYQDELDKHLARAYFIEKKLEIAMKFVEAQAEYECYVMCGCQMDAQKVLKEIREIAELGEETL